ncbi:MAG: hypothetical protein IKR18_07610 [Bacteroidaceae bacterium]|nr:hypothetical protein [Bacteroidaceae bacterium]
MKKLLLFVSSCLMAVSVWGDNLIVDSLRHERLADMSIIRKGHVSFVTPDGDIVVVGGHTLNYARTATAERLHGGVWSSISIDNYHDAAGVTTLPDGRVLIAGGYSSNTGNGKTNVCDIYNPTSNTFSQGANMAQQRAKCTCMASGIGNKVVIGGNWWNADNNFEIWDEDGSHQLTQKTGQMHSPYVAADGSGRVYVFGCYDPYNTFHLSTPYIVNALLNSWTQLSETGLESFDLCHSDGNYGMDPNLAKASDGQYIYLAKDTLERKWMLIAFNTGNGKASKLTELPQAYQGNAIKYRSGIIVSNARGEAYAVGTCNGSLVIANYNLVSCVVSLLVTGDTSTLSSAGGSCVLDPATGNLIFTGGGDDQLPVATVLSVTPYGTVNSVPNVRAEQGTEAYYNLYGQKIAAPQKGINIVRTPDGKTMKVRK